MVILKKRNLDAMQDCWKNHKFLNKLYLIIYLNLLAQLAHFSLIKIGLKMFSIFVQRRSENKKRKDF